MVTWEAGDKPKIGETRSNGHQIKRYEAARHGTGYIVYPVCRTITGAENHCFAAHVATTDDLASADAVIARISSESV